MFNKILTNQGKAGHILGVRTSMKYNSSRFANPIHILLMSSDHPRSTYALPIENK